MMNLGMKKGRHFSSERVMHIRASSSQAFQAGVRQDLALMQFLFPFIVYTRVGACRAESLIRHILN